MAHVSEVPAGRIFRPDEQQVLRVAAYCRVSTEHEEQETSLEMQEAHFRAIIEKNPNWKSAGIFSEKASGLNLKERPMFCALMRKCRKKQVDLILIKSISRLARNTLDFLKTLRELQSLNIDIYFELENLWLHEQTIQLAIIIYGAMAQAESEDMSRSIKWGIKQGFTSGKSGYADFVCFGYKRGINGGLIVDAPNAEIVHKMFELRAGGASFGTISDWLYGQGIPTPTGRSRWSRETISKLLKNEKYVGDVLLQKTYVKDLLSGKQIKNTGEKERYLYQYHHPAIVRRELFEKVNPDRILEE